VTVDSGVKKEAEEEEEEELKYTRASASLVSARQEICHFSLDKAQKRLEKQRVWRAKKLKTEDSKLSELDRLDQECMETYKRLRKVALEGSQYGDRRAVSALTVLSDSSLIISSSWMGNLHLWNTSLEPMGGKTQCHEDRIMGLDSMVTNGTTLLASASIDGTAKLWSIQEAMQEEDNDDKFSFVEQAHLQGHALRLCKTVFHPMQRHVATTSFDHTWRLWDIETAECILLQDGHCREVYGVGFHPDGSLISTTDFAGVVQVWDLRTGKSIHHYLGHVRRVLNAAFAPNGFQLSTAGDDGTIKLWDLRRTRRPAVSIPAHSSLITQIKFDASGEYMVSSSFDGTAKIWSCRNWKLLSTCRGHEGKVTCADILQDGILTSGFDKTIKLWK
jgi:U4/U6 small nuclear ribonucleoprotein PRP4